MSPLSYLKDIHAPLIVFGHDIDDLVIPVSESRSLRSALFGRAGVHYTEFAMFQHADPTKRHLRPHSFLWELWKFFRYIYPIYRLVEASNQCLHRSLTTQSWLSPPSTT